MPDFATYVCAGQGLSPDGGGFIGFLWWISPGVIFAVTFITVWSLAGRARRAHRDRRDTRDGIQHIEDWINDPDNRPRKEDR